MKIIRFIAFLKNLILLGMTDQILEEMSHNVRAEQNLWNDAL